MKIEPVVKSVWVPAESGAAFARFTDELNSWWPRSVHSVGQERCAEVRFDGVVGGRLFEIDDDGQEHEWGRVKTWEPGARLVVSWHPGRPAEQAQEVEVTFTAEGGGTRVVLTHRGWEAIGADAPRVRDGYDNGWSGVLAAYAESVGGAG